MRRKERETLTERGLLSAGSLPKGPQRLELGQAEARSLELNPGLLRGWQGPGYLSQRLLPLRVHTGREVDWKRSRVSHPGTLILIWDWGIPSSVFTTESNNYSKM